VFFRKAGFVQILFSGTVGTPPCKFGQLEKDLGLEASSLIGIRSEFSQTGCAACQLREYSVVSQFEISAYNPRDHQADQTYHKYDNA
jgi:hypothetical protein